MRLTQGASSGGGDGLAFDSFRKPVLHGQVMRTHRRTVLTRAGAGLILAALLVAGCSVADDESAAAAAPTSPNPPRSPADNGPPQAPPTPSTPPQPGSETPGPPGKDAPGW